MIQAVKLNVFYPYPPERVWKALTTRRALAAWMMENDFEPRLGHKFRFQSRTLSGIETTICCEVVELDEPNRLVYTWQTHPTAESSLVIWTLTPVERGTQLQLSHQEYSYTVANASMSRGGAGAFLDAVAPNASVPKYSHLALGSSRKMQIGAFDSTSSTLLPALIVALHSPQSFGWEYYLNQKLLDVLSHNHCVEFEQR